jgi:hypothetical protein
MLHFSSKVTLYICARQPGERGRWAAIFARLLGNFTQAECLGGWVGTKVIETEPVTKIEHWFDGEGAWALISRLLRYYRWYQQAAEQEAVSLELTHEGKWQAWVIFEGDWEEIGIELGKLFDADGQAAALYNYFIECQAEVAERRRWAENGDPSATQ